MLPYSPIERLISALRFISLLCLFIFPVLPYAVLSIAFGVFCITSLYFIKFSKEAFNQSLLLTAFFFFLVFSLSYTSNFNLGLSDLARTAPIFILPFILIFSGKKILEKYETLFKLSFVLSCLLLIAFIFSFLVKGMTIDRMPNLPNLSFVDQLSFFWSYPFEFVLEKSMFRLETGTWFMNHKTILAIYFYTALIFIVDIVFNKRQLLPLKVFLSFCSLILIASLFYLQSLVNTALLILLPVLIFVMINGNKQKILVVLTSTVILFLAFYKFDLHKKYDNRNTEAAMNLISAFYKGEVNNSSDPRLYINYCSFELIGEAPILGYGVGDVQSKLDACYNKYGFEPKVKKDRVMNSHNYYAHLNLAAGALALVSFVFMLGTNMINSLLRKKYLYAVFLILLAINLMFDNLLTRYQGAIYFGLVNTFLFMLMKNKKV